MTASKNHHRTVRRLFTAAAFALLAATGGLPAAHAAPRHSATRADERFWADDWDDAPRPENRFENWWSDRTEAAPAANGGLTPNGTGAQPGAVLVPPTGDGYYSRGRVVALSAGTALIASNLNSSVIGSAVYIYRNVDHGHGLGVPERPTCQRRRTGGGRRQLRHQSELGGRIGHRRGPQLHQ